MLQLDLPRQRRDLTQPNLQVASAILLVAEKGRKWRSLHERFDNVGLDLHAHEQVGEDPDARSAICEMCRPGRGAVAAPTRLESASTSSRVRHA